MKTIPVDAATAQRIKDALRDLRNAAEAVVYLNSGGLSLAEINSVYPDYYMMQSIASWVRWELGKVREDWPPYYTEVDKRKAIARARSNSHYSSLGTALAVLLTKLREQDWTLPPTSPSPTKDTQ